MNLKLASLDWAIVRPAAIAFEKVNDDRRHMRFTLESRHVPLRYNNSCPLRTNSRHGLTRRHRSAHSWNSRARS